LAPVYTWDTTRRGARCRTTRSEHLTNGPPRAQLLEREQGLGQLDEEVAKQRMELPWVPVEKEYAFVTEEGKKTLVEVFDGRSQLLIYHLMFGPSYEAACPGCTGLADHLDAALVHMNNRDVTLMCISRAPIEKLNAYKQRMGWRFPWPSSFASDFNFDFDFAHTEEEMKTGELAKEVAEAPDWLKDWADSVGNGSGLRDGRIIWLERLRPRERKRLPHVLANRLPVAPPRRILMEQTMRVAKAVRPFVGKRRRPQCVAPLSESMASSVARPNWNRRLICSPRGLRRASRECPAAAFSQPLGSAQARDPSCS
jgi:predicted dithiol-disulfide oxidoreductase (DUF899 family)